MAVMGICVNKIVLNDLCNNLESNPYLLVSSPSQSAFSAGGLIKMLALIRVGLANITASAPGFLLILTMAFLVYKSPLRMIGNPMEED
jgi:hypothetical protein